MSHYPGSHYQGPIVLGQWLTLGGLWVRACSAYFLRVQYELKSVHAAPNVMVMDRSCSLICIRTWNSFRLITFKSKSDNVTIWRATWGKVQGDPSDCRLGYVDIKEVPSRTEDILRRH